MDDRTPPNDGEVCFEQRWFLCGKALFGVDPPFLDVDRQFLHQARIS